MLPFSKQTNAGEEIELDDDDLVLVESPPPSFATSFAFPRLLGRGDPSTTARPRGLTASVSRRIVDESVAQDVAGECLSAIAAASREWRSASQVREAITRAAAPPLTPSRLERANRANASAPTSRLPSVSPPPFARTTTASVASHVRDRRGEPSPPPALVGRSSPVFPIAHGAGDPGAIAPVSSERPPSPTVIVVRERPKAAWVIGAAAIGAVFAVLASRLVMISGTEARPAATSPTVLTIVPPALAASIVVAPAPAATSVAASPSAAVMRFGDDQAVAFKAPPRAPASASPAPVSPVAASTAPRPRASAVVPTLPDGSLSLGASPRRTPSPAAATPAAPPPPEKKPRVLTLEQALAEAQLKASMK